VWLGTIIGLFVCFVVAAAIIGTFYTVGRDAWQAHEYYYEGAFCLVAAIIISLMGVGLLRIGRTQDKWRAKLVKALEEAPALPGRGSSKSRLSIAWLRRLMDKYVMFALPFITVLREGIEAIVFVAGVSFSAPATAIPLPTIVGLIAGSVAGYIMYK
jgi:high-affinity iron transporter